MSNINYDPNARYDEGPNAAGCNGVPPSLKSDDFLNLGLSSVVDSVGSVTAPGLAIVTVLSTGTTSDNTLSNAHYRAGFSAAGNQRNNAGPNVAGAPRGNPFSATAT